MGDRQSVRPVRPPIASRGSAPAAAPPWRAPRGHARHKLTVWCPAHLRAELDARARALGGAPGRPWPLSTVASTNDFVALACHQLCEAVEAQHGHPLPAEVTGTLQLGSVPIGSGPELGVPHYSLPWDLAADEPVERIIVRIPHPLNERMRRLERWLGLVRIDGHPAATVISKRSDLVCLAIHQLLAETPAPDGVPSVPAPRTPRATRAVVQLNAEVPPDLPARLRGLRDWLRDTDPAELETLEHTLAGLGSMSELVTLACEQLCTRVERSHNRGRPFTPRERRAS